MLSRLGVVFFWLLHWLPLSLLAPLGLGLGQLFYYLAAPRRRIALTNLRLCFPHMGVRARRKLAQRHFRMLGRSMLERGLIWWSRRERLERIVRIDGLEHVKALQAENRPIILLAPHFVGLDMGGTRIATVLDVVSIYAAQKRNPVLDRWLHHGRSRFGNQLLLSRQQGVRATVKALKSGRPFYYLPDMDYGRKDSVFVPFFGVEAATITGLSRIARIAGAAVVPCVTRMLPGGQGYVLEIGEAWEDFPTEDVTADTRRMNAWLETVVMTMPEQYYWVHRRFKTRPEGEEKLY